MIDLDTAIVATIFAFIAGIALGLWDRRQFGKEQRDAGWRDCCRLIAQAQAAETQELERMWRQ